MSYNVVGQVLNEAVPVTTPVILKYSELYNLCTNKKRFRNIVDKEFTKTWKFIFEVSGESKVYGVQLFQTMMVTTDKNTLEKRICFSFSGIISSLYINLNIDDMYYKILDKKQDEYKICDDDYLSILADKMKERTDCLRKIKKEKKLKREFPAFYKIYKEKEQQIESFKELIEILEHPEKYNRTELQIRKMLFDYLKQEDSNANLANLDEHIKIAKNFSLENFCKEYASTFDYVSERLPEIKNYLLAHPIDFSSFSKFDKEKLELYVTNQFLTTAENVPLEEKQRFLYYVTNYFLSDESRKINSEIEVTCGNIDNKMLEVNEKGYKITPKDLYERYKMLLKNNPTLHAIDFRNVDFSDMNLHEVEEYMEEFLKELSANWEFIPKENNDIEKRVLESIKNSSSKMKTEEEQQHKEHLLDLYMDKKEFYD